MNNRNLILFVITFFLLISCKSETEKPVTNYSQKANELIQQLILEENCDCILEIPKQNLNELQKMENPNIDFEKIYLKELALKNKKELDSMNNLSKNFSLNLKFLKKNNIKIIKRDSLRFLKRDINFITKTCKKGLTFFIKPIFNKEFTVAIINYGPSGMCCGIPRTTFEYKNNKWIKK
jgi:hypothetical protein